MKILKKKNVNNKQCITAIYEVNDLMGMQDVEVQGDQVTLCQPSASDDALAAR